jgi:hypothetical protein
MKLAGDPNNPARFKDDATADELRAELMKRLRLLVSAGLIDLKALPVPDVGTANRPVLASINRASMANDFSLIVSFSATRANAFVSNSADVDQCQIWDRMNCWNFIGSRTKNNGVKTALLRYLLARSAELSGKIFQFRQSVGHRQNGLSVVDVNTGAKSQRRQRRRIHVDQTQRRMISHQMADAFRAVLPLAHWGFLERPNMLGARRDPHGIRFPKRKSIDGSSGPRTAGSAMTISHDFGFA